VPLIGWRGAQSLAGLACVHLVTQVRNRAAITAAGPSWPCTYIDTEDVVGPLYRLATRLRGGAEQAWTLNSLIASLSYPLFERRAWRLLAPRICGGEFDVVHRLTPVSPGFPSFMAAKCAAIGVPFVLGPINGGVPWPAGFEAERARERERLGALRNLQKLAPSYRRTRRHATAILVGSSIAMKDLPCEFREKATLMPENAVYDSEVVNQNRDFTGATLRVVFVGRLVPLKGVSMLLDAFRIAFDAVSGRMTLDIIGDGPERAALEERALGCPGVRFTGQVPRERVMEVLKASHVLALPSIREFGGGVVVEAMACGTVPIVADYGGPRDLVPSEAGVRVPLTSRAQLVEGFAAAMTRASEDRGWLALMSDAAIRHVRTSLTWEARSRRLLALYQELIEIRVSKN
jgi:glycosyltransferase involved in cell wall biosynthesis